ncbi:hypothetical protein EZL74_01440 [Flavobacterium silvisoli]|uniref:DUF4835 family protein n=1 Tax=Flavobacterium silvisoli TaxID=2529433 RepID=A0A4Q9Z6T5_9FLAO|nr:hypothetical protein [Flavobacterium silvisoli]TBX71196.1 hypothetical protein EZL74_01440 [Flavobacterium silvisoli]
MKKILILFLIFQSMNSNSQVCVGKANYYNEKTEENTLEEINNFKNTTTVFVLPEKDRSSFEKIVKDNWDLTKYEFISLSEYKENKEKYTYPTYSFLKFDNYILDSEKTYWSFLNLNLGYSKVKQFKKNGKSTFETTFLATVFLSPVMNLKFKNYEDYNSGSSIMNYNIGFFKNQIQYINSSIKTNENFNCLQEFKNKEKLNELKTKKLFILQKARENQQFVLKNDTDSEINGLLSKYEYGYQLVSSEELNNRILNETEEFYYLMYSQINSKKIVSIISSKTGEIIYNSLDRLSYSLKDSDFKKISNEIKKS